METGLKFPPRRGRSPTPPPWGSYSSHSLMAVTSPWSLVTGPASSCSCRVIKQEYRSEGPARYEESSVATLMESRRVAWKGHPRAWAGSQCVHFPQAKTSGKFSSEELTKLWREFQHHKEKVHEYNVLLETLSRTEGVPAPPSCRRPWGGCPPSLCTRSVGGTPPSGSSGNL